VDQLEIGGEGGSLQGRKGVFGNRDSRRRKKEGRMVFSYRKRTPATLGEKIHATGEGLVDRKKLR